MEVGEEGDYIPINTLSPQNDGLRREPFFLMFH